MRTTDLIGLTYNGIQVLSLAGKLGNGAYAFNVEVDERDMTLRKFEILNTINKNKQLTEMQKKKIGTMIPNVGMIISVDTKPNMSTTYVVFDGVKVFNKTIGKLKEMAKQVKVSTVETMSTKFIPKTVSDLYVGFKFSDLTVTQINLEMGAVLLSTDDGSHIALKKIDRFLQLVNQTERKRFNQKQKKNKSKSKNKTVSIEKTLAGLFIYIYNACLSEKFVGYPNVGGKGISIAPDLDTSSKFKEWAINMGFKKGMRLKRKDISKDFSQENCYFE